jgi:hypothetical protein
MYVIAKLASNEVAGTQSEKSFGAFFGANGKFFVPSPPGVPVDVSSSSVLTPQTSGSIPYEIAQEFLSRNPNYDHVLWNFFLEVSDVAQLDTSSSAPTPVAGNVAAGFLPTMIPSPLGPRCQVGRAVGPAPVGVAPNSVAVLPANTKSSGTPQYGSLIFDTVDLTPYNPATPGTDEVLVWWRIARATTSEDVVQGFGATAGQNTPSLRRLQETPPNFSGFRVYASVDDGVSWYECNYLRPRDLVTAGTDFRLAFINESSEKLYLLGVAVLFPNL